MRYASTKKARFLDLILSQPEGNLPILSERILGYCMLLLSNEFSLFNPLKNTCHSEFSTLLLLVFS